MSIAAMPRITRTRLAAAVALALCAASGHASAAAEKIDAKSVFDMSLEELLSVPLHLPATLTKLTLLESPAATTVITAEDIRLTPARNLYDLMEVYVPGAYWETSETGPHPGLRGNIAARNYRYLLLVNGRAMNNKAFAGANSEMEMWDLSDIERIEIVNGPGSVTYGAGAVAGVISITTRKPDASLGTTASIGYLGPYKSQSLTLSHHQAGDAYKLFAHASVVRTEGQTARTFQVGSNNVLGFLGQDFQPTSRPLPYFGDYQDQPQIKLHVEVDFANDWQWWTRYTQQGSNWFSNEAQSNFGGELLNQEGLRSRQFATAVQHGVTLSDTLSFSTQFSFDSYDFERRGEGVRNPNPDHPLNYTVNFAEDELVARGVLNWQAADWAQVAFGAEWSRDRFKPGWGDDAREMRLGESGEIVNGPDSLSILAGNGGSANRLAPAWPAIYVGDGWNATTTSLFTEANLALGAHNKVLLSGRADKNTYTGWLLSPRLAWITTLADGHVLKAIVQRSSRMNTASQMFANAQRGIANDPEKLDSLELRYSAQVSKALGFDLAAFRNQAEVISFQGADNTNRLIGNLTLNGLEAEVHYAWARGRIGANASWVKQKDWTLQPGIISSGVSYADYNVALGGATGGIQRGYGNDLANWPNQALKVFGNYKFNDSLTLHADLRWFSALQGEKDGLAALRQALAGTARATPAFYAALARIEAEHVYDSDIRFNALLDYAVTAQSSVQLYGQNLFSHNGSKRYAYDSGNNNVEPRRVRLVEEPTTLGVRLLHRF